jgi:hypothetical protein
MLALSPGSLRDRLLALNRMRKRAL